MAETLSVRPGRRTESSPRRYGKGSAACAGNKNPLESCGSRGTDALCSRKRRRPYGRAARLRRTSVSPQAKPWRRRNSLPPSISNFHGYHKKGHTHQVWPFYGGDYWTRTSDLLRVKMRRDVKALLLGAFRHFLPRFLWVQITALSTVSTR